MSTHNIDFNEDLTKIIFQLSPNTHLISSSGPLIAIAKVEATSNITSLIKLGIS